MPKSNRRTERRPRDGDTQTCPFCRGLMFLRDSKSDEAEPGWFCSCGYRILLRQPTKKSAAELGRELGERQAKAIRKSMALQARSERLMENSEQLIRRRRREK